MICTFQSLQAAYLEAARLLSYLFLSVGSAQVAKRDSIGFQSQSQLCLIDWEIREGG